MYPKDEDRSLLTKDIALAQPHYRHLNYLEKPDLSVGCTEPEHAGGRARSYYAPMDRRPRDLSLTTADIEYAQPKKVRSKGARHTDPVCPNYELPSYFKPADDPPRWNGRHTNDISDIEKSGPKVLHPERNYVRDPNDARDIEYAQPCYEERLQLRQSSSQPRLDRSLNVTDITGIRQIRSRCTNPLDPVYKVTTAGTTSLFAKYSEERGMQVKQSPVQVSEIGEVPGSKPRKLQWDNGEPQLSLLREDIAGTLPQRWVGAVPHNIYDPPEIRPMISFHDPNDIAGAQVGTLKKGLEASRRCLNPLNPKYTMLDGNPQPQPVPTFDAERAGVISHPLIRNRGASSSTPNLRSPSYSEAQQQQHQQQMHRDYSDATIRRPENRPGSGAGLNYGGSQQSSRSPSVYGDYEQDVRPQRGIRYSAPSDAGSQQGMMSRRSYDM